MHKPKILSGPKSANKANNDAVTKFLTEVTTQSVSNVMSCFCADASPVGPPVVGIASHGPNFTGTADINILFTQLFTSFPNLVLKEETVYSPRLYSLDGYTGLQTISVIATLKGRFEKSWFPKTDDPDVTSHYSKPLSDIRPQTGTNHKSLKGIPSVAIFALDTSNQSQPLIARLSLYTDRYRFEHELKPSAD